MNNLSQSIAIDTSGPSGNNQPAMVDRLFNEAALEAAYNNAGPLARKRFLKKVQKIKWRKAYWKDTTKETKSLVPTGYVAKQPLPSGNLQSYLLAFITTFAPEYVAEGKVYSE